MDSEEDQVPTLGRAEPPQDDATDTLGNKNAQSRFAEFLKNFRDHNIYTYRERLTMLNPEKENTLEIDLADLKVFDSVLLENFQEYPKKYLEDFENAAKETYDQFNKGVKGRSFRIHLTYKSDQATTFIRDLNASHVGKLVHVPGIVISASKAHPQVSSVTIRCSKCNYRDVLKSNGSQPVAIPRYCTRLRQEGEENTCGMDPFEILPDECKYENSQSLKLQECPEDVTTGEMPRHILCRLSRTLVDRVSPGTRVSLIAFVDLFEASKKPLTNTVAIRTSYLQVLGIQVDLEGAGRAQQSFTAEEEEEFIRLSKTKNIYELLSNSIAPAISGDYTVDIKKALCCLLFGGTPRVLADRTRLRGDINILLMGDPSTAKSQFLKFVDTVAPIGVYTSGKGSSAAGLTASVIQDSRGEFYLEGGAMVLADGGVVCIDEFDKMREVDRVAIHEAMEQQTISIAKAGITTVLNSRCSVLAAANPIYGRYDDSKSTSENIDFLPTILSRFDLIFIVRDVKEYNKDIAMAKHIINLHLRGNTEESSEADIPIQTMKRYIAYCRAKCNPVLNDEAANVLRNHYVSIRDEVQTRALQEGVNSSVPITVRQLEAIIRISESLAKMRLSNEATVEDVNEALRLFKLSTLQATKSGAVTSDILTPELIKQVDTIEMILKSRVALNAQVKRSRLIHLLKSLGYNTYISDRAITTLVRRKEFDEVSQGRYLIRRR